MKRISLQWRLTCIITVYIAVICGCLTMFVYKNGVYYMDTLQEKVDALAGEKGYEALQDCLDRTLSKDPAERVEAMKEAQNILAKMYEKGETKA